eukprot:PhF_6_TR21046/c0_g1_i2/m.30291
MDTSASGIAKRKREKEKLRQARRKEEEAKNTTKPGTISKTVGLDDDDDVHLVVLDAEAAAASLPDEYRPQFTEMYERAYASKYIAGEDSNPYQDEAMIKAAHEAAMKKQQEMERGHDKRKRWTPGKLKLVVARPDLVEFHDVNAKDPISLLHFRGYRGSVPVPRHWLSKSHFLSKKRSANHHKESYVLPSEVVAADVPGIRKRCLENDFRQVVDIDYGKLRANHHKESYVLPSEVVAA